MKAIVSHGTLDFRLDERPVPEMDEYEVLIEVHYCGVCGTDIHMYHGTWELYPGHTPGHEASGIVRKVGAKVDQFSPGDHLVALPRHVCPTSALHQVAHVIEDGRLVDRWDVVARDRVLTV